jgi:hypothetical protein
LFEYDEDEGEGEKFCYKMQYSKNYVAIVKGKQNSRILLVINFVIAVE